MVRGPGSSGSSLVVSRREEGSRELSCTNGRLGSQKSRFSYGEKECKSVCYKLNNCHKLALRYACIQAPSSIINGT